MWIFEACVGEMMAFCGDCMRSKDMSNCIVCPRHVLRDFCASRWRRQRRMCKPMHVCASHVALPVHRMSLAVGYSYACHITSGFEQKGVSVVCKRVRSECCDWKAILGTVCVEAGPVGEHVVHMKFRLFVMLSIKVCHVAAWVFQVSMHDDRVSGVRQSGTYCMFFVQLCVSGVAMCVCCR